jgi:hypothetical protein
LEYANKLQGDCGVPQDAMQGEEGATTAGTTDASGSIHWGQCIITDNCSRKSKNIWVYAAHLCEFVWSYSIFFYDITRDSTNHLIPSDSSKATPFKNSGA